MERRFMGNTNELLTFKEICNNNTNMKLKDHELVVTLIDPRLYLDTSVMIKEMWKNYMELFKKGHVDLYITMKAFDKKKEADKKEQFKEVLTTDVDEKMGNTNQV